MKKQISNYTLNFINRISNFMKLYKTEQFPDSYKLRDDVVAYTKDYQLKDGSMVIPPERLQYWTDYFGNVPNDQKMTVCHELLAWAAKCIRIAQGKSGIELAVQNTMDIAAMLFGVSPELFVDGIGNGIIYTENTNVAIKDGKVVGRNVQEQDYEGLPVLPPERAFDRLGEEACFNLEQMRKTVELSREESKKFFHLTLITASIGFAIIVTGIVLLFFARITQGVVSFTAGIIPEVLAAVFFRKDKELRATVSAYNERIQESQVFLNAVSIAETIESPESRSLIKTKIVASMLERLK